MFKATYSVLFPLNNFKWENFIVLHFIKLKEELSACDYKLFFLSHVSSAGA